jgi:Zn-dependent M28 family amino/carboxypeptidase
LSFSVKTTAKTKLVQSPNVLGYIEGSDPELKKEVVVIGAHLDHLGKRGDYIFNGADDNGSGSVGVMELAEAFALNPVKPKRSVLFALWTGEEKGLLGSRYYVTHPVYPLKKTVANINLDMISRTWDKTRLKRISRMMGTKLSEEQLKKIDVENFIAVSYDANAKDIRQFMVDNNQYVGLALYLRKTTSIMSGGGGSDHMPFGMSKIPWAFFMAAMTKDYHQPSDSIEKISEKLMRNITRLSFLTAFSIANQ